MTTREPRICPICEKAGLSSRVYPMDGYATTDMAGCSYYDEVGKYHRHDPNTRTSGGRCSNGHRYTEVLTNSCPNCDWKAPGSVEWENLGQDTRRRAPVQGDGKRDGRPPGTISWDEHERAWSEYSRRFGRSQSAEVIAERHGFSYHELTMFLGHEPETWKPL